MSTTTVTSPELKSSEFAPKPESRSLLQGSLDRLLLPGVLLRAALYLTLLTFLPSVLFDYVYDDIELIQFNPWIASWHGIATAFTHAFWAFTDFPRATDYYRPLVMTFLIVMRHVAGSAPAWFHLVVIGVHLLAVYLTYRLACVLTGDACLAAIAAAIFGLHPTKLESVAWISGVSDSMCVVFCLACLLTHFRWKRQRAHTLRWFAMALLMLAMLSKEMAVAVPLLIAIHEGLSGTGSLRARARSAMKTSAPYFFVVAVALCMRTYAMRNVAPAHLDHLFAYSFYTFPHALLWYLGKQLLPLPIRDRKSVV